jgi:plastocyanin
MHFRSVLLVASIALTLAFAGCMSTPTKTPTPSSGQGGHVEMKNIAFAPKEVTIKAGEKVTWTNKEAAINHDVTPKGETTSWNSSGKGGIKPGESFEKTFDAAGTYEYFCQEHGTSMSGTITVTA